MKDMKSELGTNLISAFQEALLVDGGIEQICAELIARRDRNVEAGGEQSAQLTFTFRPRIEVSNHDFSVVGEVKVDEQKKSHVFRVERNFCLDAEQGELPLDGETPDSESNEEDEPGEGEEEK